MHRLLIAHDDEAVRRSVIPILRDEFGELEIGAAGTFDELLGRLRTRSWDLIVLDSALPGPGGIEALGAIRRLRPDARVLVLTATLETQDAVRTIAAGANGYITTREASDVLAQAVHALLRGETFLSQDVVQALTGATGEAPALPHDRLSPRELEVFLLIARGRTVKEVAASLSVTDKTVATYMSRIREKTDLQSYVEIARYALRHGLVG